MSRSGRLLDLLQLLRLHRRPISGKALASQLNISLRTLYRDIATLQAQGAAIEGEPGVGYLLRPGFTLPPLMFTQDELAALVLGSSWVAERADMHLSNAATHALAKISAVLPDELRNEIDTVPLLIGPANVEDETVDLGAIRQAIKQETKLQISYRDAQGIASDRVIWPFALGFFERVCIVIAWCELRQEVRHFRTDRINELLPSDVRYPRRRQLLLKEWREQQGIMPQR